MTSWRGLVVIIAAGVGGFVAMFGWLVINKAALGVPWPQEMFVELLGVMLAAIFAVGRIAARVLVGKAAAQEIAASGRWRARAVALSTGIILVLARLVLEGAERWTAGHIAALVLGVALLLYAAWDLTLRRHVTGSRRASEAARGQS